MQQMFDYLYDVMYNPSNAELNLEDLDGDALMLGKGLLYLGASVTEMRDLAQALSRGDLSGQLPPSSNELASPLKALHASLRHLTWQAQQIADGDYNQQVDFMGEFAEAFNRMTRQLAGRTQALEREIAEGKAKTLALEQSNDLLAMITSNTPQLIVVLKAGTSEVLFSNRAAQAVLSADPGLMAHLLTAQHTPVAADGEENHGVREGEHFPEYVQTIGGESRYFSVLPYQIFWNETSATAFMLSDISTSRRHLKKLESYAYQDNLTKLYNRFFGMRVLRQWLEEKRSFSLCFVDLDNLKYINDEYGHAEGDMYLINAAEQLSRFSADAVVSRVGGDEFFLLVPEYTEEQAVERIKTLNRRLQEKYRDEKKDYHINFSYGVVAVETETGLSASELLHMADERMYRNKRENKKLNRMPLDSP